jgi:hypothetical protein
MKHHGEDARMRRLRAARDAALAQVWAVEALAGEWKKAAERMEAPEGFTRHWDAGTAAAVIRRVLAEA